MLLTSSLGLDFAILLVIAVFIFYKYLTRNFDYWKTRGVFHVPPTPLFGNLAETFKFKMTLAEQLKCLYDKTDKPYLGIYVIDTPVLLIRSPKLIEHILIKDFSYFRNRSMASPKHNPYIANFVVFQQYNDWKKTRQGLTSLFSNSKLKGMFHTAQPIIQDMDIFLTTNANIFEAKDLGHRFSTEVVTRCYFGLTGNCFQDDNSTIFQITRRSFDFSLRNAVVQLLYIFKPTWVDFFKLNFMRISDQDYLINAFLDVVEARKNGKKTNGKAMDYIDVILEAKENTVFDSSKLGMVEVLSNTLQFFLAGTETMSGLQSFSLYELALNREVQVKLRKEILEVQKKHGGITFEALHEMEYLEWCMFETMRKYVTLQILDRKTVEDYVVPGTDFLIEKGTVIYIPLYAIHNDKDYYPDPDKFIPERFQNVDLNKDGVQFMPFGCGPRICLGERFGLIMSKYMIAAIVASYELEPCDKTPIPLKLEPKSFTFQSQAPLLLKIKRIKE